MLIAVARAAPWSPQEPLAHRLLRSQVLQEDMMANEEPVTPISADAASACRSGVHLEWTAHVGSSALATPRVVDLNNDGNKEILVPTYSQYLEAIDGMSGGDVAGFPFVHPNFKSYASPLPVDMSGDGKTDWLVAMYTGELIVFSDDGQIEETIQIPHLPVKKKWVHENVTTGHAVNVTFKMGHEPIKLLEHALRMRHIQDWTRFQPRRSGHTDGSSLRNHTSDYKLEKMNLQVRKEMDMPAPPARLSAPADPGDNDRTKRQGDTEGGAEESADSFDTVHDDIEDALRYEELSGEMKRPHTIGTDGWLSDEAKASMDLLYHPELYKSSVNHGQQKDAFSFQSMVGRSEAVVAEDEVAVDPHIISNLVIADADGDGYLDIVLHVSYFFDPKDYEGDRADILTKDTAMNNYVADAVVVIDLITGGVKWMKTLNITTKKDAVPAYAFSTPVVVNYNENGGSGIFVTTTAGAIFGFTGEGGMINGWPVWMDHPVIASVSVEDVNGDGVLDVCTGDTSGVVACFSANGRRLWSTRVSGAVSDHIVFGDVDGDGLMDLAFGTTSGLIYALRGHDGLLLPHFPIATGGTILAPPLLVNLNDTVVWAHGSERGLHIVIPSHDGVLYIVSGATGCVDGIDIGEKASAMVLADDVTGNGKLDLVVSTLAGSIMVLETSATFHPLKAWPSRVKSVNGFTAGEGHVGVFIDPSSRVVRDVRGETFSLLVAIHDQRNIDARKRRYRLVITIGPRVLVHDEVYTDPGTYSIQMHAPLERMYASVHVVMVLPNGQRYEDSLAMSFNMHFLESVKYTFLMPFFLACLAISLVDKRHEVVPELADTGYY
ncbi:putative FG-GAP repeat protein [Trypanosoma vivax]|nr:putative FG-GAP repeat protein [Trypanosoma vivax]